MLQIKNLTIIDNKKILTFITAYTVLCMLLFIYTPLDYKDSIYYYEWSRHLSLSYYDGPPLIAYLLRLHTQIFGHSHYAIKLLALFTTTATGGVIYLLAKEMFHRDIALTATLLWCLNPYIFQEICHKTSYDNPMVLCWALTLYFFYLYYKYNKIKFIYFTAISAGLLMLSKYTGILLIGSLLLIILLSANYRQIIYTKHFYTALLISCLLFSPVIIWNYQHDWVSFYYQLNHGLGSNVMSMQDIARYLRHLFAHYNLPLLLMLFGSCYTAKKNKLTKEHLLLLSTSLFVLIFFFITSIKNNVMDNWVIPYFISGSILAAYYVNCFNLKKLFYIFIIFCSAIIVKKSAYFYYDKIPLPISTLTLQANPYYRPGGIIIANSWRTAAYLTGWLKGQPNVYVLCGKEQNQYQFWNTAIKKDIRNKKIKQVLYFKYSDFPHPSLCINTFFSQCVEEHHIVNPKYPRHSITIYKCYT